MKRFHQSKDYSSHLYKGIILQQLKQDFIPKIKSLLRDGKVGRRYLYEVLGKNNYFKTEIKDIVSTTEGQGLTLGQSSIVLKANEKSLLKSEFANATVTQDTINTVKEIHSYLNQLNTVEQVPMPDLKERHEYSKNNLNPYYEFREPLLPEALAHLAPKVEKPVFKKGSKHKPN